MDSRRKTIDDHLTGFSGALCKFFAAGLLGGLVCDLLLFSAAVNGLEGLLTPPCVHLFWIIPLACGILGVFRINSVLNNIFDLIEQQFGCIRTRRP